MALIGCLFIGCGQIKDDSISNEAVNTQTADNIDISKEKADVIDNSTEAINLDDESFNDCLLEYPQDLFIWYV